MSQETINVALENRYIPVDQADGHLSAQSRSQESNTDRSGLRCSTLCDCRNWLVNTGTTAEEIIGRWNMYAMREGGG